ncbi:MULTISPECIES: hypothetical protein [unclassified Microcystis]|jgi:hypothetical protein|uniref:hypothetical protein n=1 Tax=unclassified Microcystis TaxID=2643300 RepID=UPI0025844A0B|nr:MULTISPECIES: hypothetical protein [unclassified Microcystis]MCA2763982.1 hypothetical protein [Microcystis sp. M151S2]MCA2642830.1 hypothetical protein [Microcystis sp. M087S2]MCA2671419.1 hypothetical protein [Microcystis sp. M080S2]MCA2689381.1 hypothetical protein [Microcystis sp. M037S2]MCA2736064.1 hypothetical protein [Microcystis sp. M158S2]
MNSLPSSVERENLGQILLENLQEITDKLDKIVTDSDRIILDNLLQETKILLDRVKDNSKTYQARADIFGRINQLWFQVWKQYRDEDSALELIRYIDQFTNQITAYNQLFSGLAKINEGRTGEEKADLIRVVEGSLILSETIDVFIDMFADSELEQIKKFAQNALSFSNRTITEYFQDTDKSSLVTQLRAYYSLIIFRIQERFNPKNVSSETTSHSLTDNFNDLDASRQNLTGLVDLETEKSSSENWLDNLSGSISDQEAFQKALEYGRVFRQNVSSETTSHSLTDDLSDLDPWTRDLVGVVDLGSEDPKESYIDYLVEKYR